MAVTTRTCYYCVYDETLCLYLLYGKGA